METLLAVISGQSLVNVVIWIVVAGLCYWLLTWMLDKIALPEPFNKVARVVLVVVVVMILISVLLGLAGVRVIKW